MIFKSLKGILLKTSFIFIGFLLLSISAAYSFDSPAKSNKPASNPRETKVVASEWETVLEAAKKEGKLMMAGPPSEVWRKPLVDMFREEYPDIALEYTGVAGRDFGPRIRKERELGQKLWDLLAGGTTTALEVKVAGFTVPIRPLLLPEIADESKWFGGLEGLFHDRENMFMPAYTMAIQRTTAVNRDIIKESDIKSSEQLTDPKFKGKIVMQNPIAGSTFAALSNLVYMYGGTFVRDLLLKQDAIFTDSNRQEVEWVVRGKYPIAVGFDPTTLIPFKKQGLGKNVVKLEDKIFPVGTSYSAISLFKDAPHPNAARVYINWLLSQKTQAKLSKIVELNSRRTDVPIIDKESVVDPANLSKYYNYSSEESLEKSRRLLPMIKESLKK